MKRKVLSVLMSAVLLAAIPGLSVSATTSDANPFSSSSGTSSSTSTVATTASSAGTSASTTTAPTSTTTTTTTTVTTPTFTAPTVNTTNGADGVTAEIVTSKDSFTANETIPYSIRLRNNSGSQISAVYTLTYVPGYREDSVQVGTMNAGADQYTAIKNLTVNTATYSAATDSGTQTTTTTNTGTDAPSGLNQVNAPQTAASDAMGFFWIMLAVAALGFLSSMTQVRHGRRGAMKKFFGGLFIVALIFGALPATTARASGSNTSTERRCFSVSKQITVDGVSRTITAYVTYNISVNNVNKGAVTDNSSNSSTSGVYTITFDKDRKDADVKYDVDQYRTRQTDKDGRLATQDLNRASDNLNFDENKLTFNGWFTERDGKGTKITGGSSGYQFKGNTTVYADWTEKGVYSIQFCTIGLKSGSSTEYEWKGQESKTTGTNGKLSSLATAPEKSGYTFVGWYTEQTGGNRVTTDTVFDKNSNVFARYTMNITVDRNGGTWKDGSSSETRKWDAITNVQQTKGTLSSTELDAIRDAMNPPTNQTYVGLYTERTGGTQITSSMEFIGATTIYARWSGQGSSDDPTPTGSIRIIYHTQGGTPQPDDRFVNPGDVVGDLPSVTKEGFTLKGWYRDETGTGTAITSNTTVQSGGTVLNLYAVWEENTPIAETYTVSFVTNGGSNVSAQNVTSGDRAQEPQNCTKEGYTLEGWYNNADNTKWNFASKTVTEDVILYANWVSDEYLVTFAKVPGMPDGTGDIAPDKKEQKVQNGNKVTPIAVSDIVTASGKSVKTGTLKFFRGTNDITSTIGNLTVEGAPIDIFVFWEEE